MRYLALVLPILVACGDGEEPRHISDARQADASETLLDAAPQLVKLTIKLDGAPVANVKVHFQNPDSTSVLTTVTNASGTASANVLAGGFVTAINAFPPANGTSVYDRLHTFAGVKPGDQLLLSDTSQLSIAVDVTAPEDVDPNVSYYYFSTPCGEQYVASAGSGSQPVATMYLYDCGATTDFLVTSFDSGGIALNSFFLAGVAVTDTGSVDLTAQTFAATTQRTYTHTNLGTLGTIDLADAVISPRGLLTMITGSTTGSTQLDIPTFTGATSVVMSRAPTASIATHYLLDWGPFTSTYSVDVGARLLPEITASPVADLANQKITWTEAASSVAPEFAMTNFSAYRSSTSAGWEWKIVSPYAAGELQLPTLQGNAVAYNFEASDSVYVYDLTLGKAPGGYDAVRAAILAAQGPTSLVTTPTGAITYEDISGSIGRTGQPSRPAPWRPRRRM